MSCEISDTPRVDAHPEDKSLNKTVDLDSKEMNNLKMPQTSRKVLISAFVAVFLLIIVTTAILASYFSRTATDLQSLTHTLTDLTNKFEVKITEVNGVTKFLVHSLSNETTAGRDYCSTTLREDGEVSSLQCGGVTEDMPIVN